MKGKSKTRVLSFTTCWNIKPLPLEHQTTTSGTSNHYLWNIKPLLLEHQITTSGTSNHYCWNIKSLPLEHQTTTTGTSNHYCRNAAWVLNNKLDSGESPHWVHIIKTCHTAMTNIAGYTQILFVSFFLCFPCKYSSVTQQCIILTAKITTKFVNGYTYGHDSNTGCIQVFSIKKRENPPPPPPQQTNEQKTKKDTG